MAAFSCSMALGENDIVHIATRQWNEDSEFLALLRIGGDGNLLEAVSIHFSPDCLTYIERIAVSKMGSVLVPLEAGDSGNLSVRRMTESFKPLKEIKGLVVEKIDVETRPLEPILEEVKMEVLPLPMKLEPGLRSGCPGVLVLERR
jgi:hypothetical protein